MIEKKIKRGYIKQHSAYSALVGSEAYEMVNRYGFLTAGYTDTLNDFLIQFGPPPTSSSGVLSSTATAIPISGLRVDKIWIDDIAKIVAPKASKPEESKIQRIRSPKFGSW